MVQACMRCAVLLSQLTPVTSELIPTELREAMRARHEAVCTLDAATWDRLTAEEFTVVVPEGRLLTKPERLAALKTERPRPGCSAKEERILHIVTATRRFTGSSMETNGSLRCGPDRAASGVSSRRESISRNRTLGRRTNG